MKGFLNTRKEAITAEKRILAENSYNPIKDVPNVFQISSSEFVRS
jgi:hypothetical protein